MKKESELLKLKEKLKKVKVPVTHYDCYEDYDGYKPVLVSPKMFKFIKKAGWLVRKTKNKKGWIVDDKTTKCVIIVITYPSHRAIKRESKKLKKGVEEWKKNLKR